MKKSKLLLLSAFAAIGLSSMTPASAADINLVGFYDLAESQWFLNKEHGDQNTYKPRVYKGDEENEYYFTGLPVGTASFKGTFNPSDMTITVEAQYLYYNKETLEDIWLQWEDVEEDYLFYDEAVLTVDEDGTIRFPEDKAYVIRYITREPAKSYLYGTYGIVLKPHVDADAFRLLHDEWDYVGTAMYGDNVLLGYGEYEDEESWELFRAVGVPLYKHKSIEGEFLLRNPYDYETDMLDGGGGPLLIDWVKKAFSLTTGMLPFTQAPGYVRFNVADPDVVIVRPYIGTGVWSNFYDANAFDELYVYNREGLLAHEGKTTDQIDNALRQDGKDCSYYDPSEKCAHIFNCLIGTTTEKIEGFSWFGDQKDLLMRIWFDRNATPVEEPADLKGDDVFGGNGGDGGNNNDNNNDNNDPATDGISSVGGDSQAPRYFNLQGIELANPTPGQIVIKKSGNTVQKVIVK